MFKCKHKSEWTLALLDLSGTLSKDEIVIQQIFHENFRRIFTLVGSDPLLDASMELVKVVP